MGRAARPQRRGGLQPLAQRGGREQQAVRRQEKQASVALNSCEWLPRRSRVFHKGASMPVQRQNQQGGRYGSGRQRIAPGQQGQRKRQRVSGRDKIRETDGGRGKAEEKEGRERRKGMESTSVEEEGCCWYKVKRSIWVKVLERRGGQ